MSYGYVEQKQIGDKYEEIIDRHLVRCGLAPRRVQQSFQRLGIDRWLQWGSLWSSVEYKADSAAARSACLFLEVSVRRRASGLAGGWATKCMAQLVLILIPPARRLLWANTWELKAMLEHWCEIFTVSEEVTSVSESGNWTKSRGVLVPIKDFKAACVFREDKIEI